MAAHSSGVDITGDALTTAAPLLFPTITRRQECVQELVAIGFPGDLAERIIPTPDPGEEWTLDHQGTEYWVANWVERQLMVLRSAPVTVTVYARNYNIRRIMGDECDSDDEETRILAGPNVGGGLGGLQFSD